MRVFDGAQFGAFSRRAILLVNQDCAYEFHRNIYLRIPSFGLRATKSFSKLKFFVMQKSSSGGGRSVARGGGGSGSRASLNHHASTTRGPVVDPHTYGMLLWQSKLQDKLLQEVLYAI